MDYQFATTLISIEFYVAYIIWTILAMLIVISSIKRNWNLLKRTLKYIMNTTVFIIGFAFIWELALIVRPALYETKEKTSIALKLWIGSHQVNDIYVSTITILVLLCINFFFYFRVEHKQNKKDLFILTIFDALTLFTNIWLTGISAYFGLMQEINRYFH